MSDEVDEFEQWFQGLLTSGAVVAPADVTDAEMAALRSWAEGFWAEGRLDDDDDRHAMGDVAGDELEAMRQRKTAEDMQAAFDASFRRDANAPNIGAEFDDAERRLAQRGRRADWEVLAHMREVRDPVCAREALLPHMDALNKPVEVWTPGATEPKQIPVAIDQAVLDELDRILADKRCTGPPCDRCLPAWQNES